MAVYQYGDRIPKIGKNTYNPGKACLLLVEKGCK